MAGVTYKLEDRDARGVFGRLARAADNPRPALEAIGAYGVFSTQRRFERETDPEGHKWTPLSPRTANRRVGRGRRGYKHILRVSLALFRSINYLADARSVEWGSNLVYARIHQLGGSVDIPARTQRLTLKRTRRKGGGFTSRFARATATGSTRQIEAEIGAHQIRIPARPYLGVNDADRDEIVQIVNDFLRKEAGQ